MSNLKRWHWWPTESKATCCWVGHAATIRAYVHPQVANSCRVISLCLSEALIEIKILRERFWKKKLFQYLSLIGRSTALSFFCAVSDCISSFEGSARLKFRAKETITVCYFCSWVSFRNWCPDLCSACVIRVWWMQGRSSPQRYEGNLERKRLTPLMHHKKKRKRLRKTSTTYLPMENWLEKKEMGWLLDLLVHWFRGSEGSFKWKSIAGHISWNRIKNV